MTEPLVTVIIPTYSGVNFIEDAIQSVLGQTYSNFELIIVNDASPDNTTEVISKYHDPRIHYIVQEKNRGVDQARCTGILASHGEIIAFLDQDDYFHPEKLESHVEWYRLHPDTGFTYNARFELNYSAETIRSIWRPSRNITLADLVLWFPIAPSDWVLRREWALKLVELIDRNPMWTGGEIVYLGSFFMSGCQFALVDQALNYRRHHSKRIFRDIPGGCRSEILAQEKIFNDPRCPVNVLALRDEAHANIYAFWAFRAFVQDETGLGEELIHRAIQYRPSILNGKPCELVEFLVINCSDDENEDYQSLLRKVFDQLPRDISSLSGQFDWALPRGFLLKGSRAAIWDRPEDAEKYFQYAKQFGAKIDESFLSHVTKSLMDYEMEFGSESSQRVQNILLSYLKGLADARELRQLRGMLALNHAFQSYHDECFDKVPELVLQTMVAYPKYIFNRGLYAILFRSFYYQAVHIGGKKTPVVDPSHIPMEL